MLSIEDLTVGFGRERPAVDRFSLEIAVGEAVMVSAAAGAGKSTLLAAAAGIVPRLVRAPQVSGLVRLSGRPIAELANAELFAAIGIVMQNLDDQLWNLSVEDLAAFPLENRQTPPATMRARVGELMAQLHIAHLSGRQVLSLSGGERRMAALAAALAAAPGLLVLDEPTMGLDPAARARLVAALGRLRAPDAAATAPAILVAEQDAAALAPVVDRVALMAEGRLLYAGETRSMMAEPARWSQAGLLAPGCDRPPRKGADLGRPLLEIEGLETVLRRPGGEPVLRGVDLTLRGGEVVALVGPNGAGKTTLFQTVLGLARAAKGRLAIAGERAEGWTPGRRARHIGYLPQNMRRVLFNMTVRDEVAFAIAGDTRTMADPAVRARAEAALGAYELAGRAEDNPFALSVREQALLGLACVASAGCDIAILDEPLLARDAKGRAMLGRFLDEARGAGRAVMLISHDLDLVDAVADRVLVLRDGRIAYTGPAEEAWGSEAFRSLGWPSPRTALDFVA